MDAKRMAPERGQKVAGEKKSSRVRSKPLMGSQRQKSVINGNHTVIGVPGEVERDVNARILSIGQGDHKLVLPRTSSSCRVFRGR